MTDTVPVLTALPPGLVLEGEIWRGETGVLNRDAPSRSRSSRSTSRGWRAREHDGRVLRGAPCRPRSASLRPPTAVVAETFTDGAALFAGSGWKAWSRSACRAVTGRTSAAGSRRRTRTTGVATPSARRWNVHASDVRERSSSSARPLHDPLTAVCLPDTDLARCRRPRAIPRSTAPGNWDKAAVT
jgi:hypothetical protein